MPELYFRVRWPDGTVQRCYSPSTVVEDFLSAGEQYPVTEFVERSRRALTIANQRVREKYGFGCGNADLQVADIERTAAAFGGLREGQVFVEGFEP